MNTEIAGLTYKREPAPGERLCIIASDDFGGMCIARVEIMPDDGPGAIIAWDQIETPAKADRRASAYGLRRRLAYAAAEHWRARGFDVTLVLLND